MHVPARYQPRPELSLPPDVLLRIEDLRTYFPLMEGTVKAVDSASLTLRRGRTLAVVGESGCGKSVMARSVMQIVDRPGKIVSGSMLYRRQASPENGRSNGRPAAREAPEVIDLAALPPNGSQIRAIRGEEIAMIFQEPMTSFSPVHTIGSQIAEAIRLHHAVTKQEARERTIEMLRRVGMPRPERHVDEYPHQISGGMRQRAMIAMALSCGPQLLIADEPSTALDVTTQAQIMELMLQLKDEMGMSIMLITHDLAVVAEMADDVAVMYLGRIVEQANVESLFYDAKHPYTQALLRSIPQLGRPVQRLEVIRGMVPDPYNRPPGCTFHPRCRFAMRGLCNAIEPPVAEVSGGRRVRCLLYGGAEGVSGASVAIAARTDRMAQLRVASSNGGGDAHAG